jgi:hypothetical protein
MSVLGNTVTAADFNNLIGYDPTTTLNTFNAVWGTGSGKFGYGQTPIPNLDNPDTTLGDDIIKAEAWSNLILSAATSAAHQGTVITPVYNTSYMPAAGVQIQAETLARITSGVTSLYTSHLNATSQGTSANYPEVNSSSWNRSILFEHTVTFADGDSARYFFNCGGQLALTFSSPPGTKINALMSKLGESAGTLVISSPNVETIKIATTNYQGVTKIGGVVPPPVDTRYTKERYGVKIFNQISPTIGYYGMSTSYQEIFKQSAGGFPTQSTRYNYYDGSYIGVYVKTNGPQGTRGDNGNVITVRTVWDQVPDGLPVTPGTTTTLTVRPPFLRTGMTKSWGTPVVSSRLTGD